MKSFKSVLSSIIFTVVAMVGCASATVTEPTVCESQSVAFSFPKLPSVPVSVSGSVTIPFVQTSTSLDVSSSFDKVTSVAKNLQVTIQGFDITAPNNELGWVQRSQIWMQKGTDLTTQVTLGFLLGDNFILQATGNQMLDYFSSGPVTLTIDLGSPGGTVVDASTLQMLQNLNGQVSASMDICLSVSGSFSKSL
jgi:hypothetical protein